MRIHDTLTPVRGLCPDQRDRILTGRLLGDGGYSRVIAHNAYSVVKLTTCVQTQLLLDTLVGLGRDDHPVGLPVVLEQWGIVAKDADGKAFKGYVVERLFDANQVAERFRGKRTGAVAIGARRKTANEPFTRSVEALRLLTGALEAARDRCLLGIREVAEEHLEMAEQLAVMRLPCQFESTFGYLADFLRTSKGELDLFQAGNILLDLHGYPVLADPVAEQTAEPTVAPDRSPKILHALVARIVVGFEGLKAATVWDTFAVSEDATALTREMKGAFANSASVVEAKVMRNGCPEHRRLVNSGRLMVGAWSAPHGTAHQVFIE